MDRRQGHRRPWPALIFALGLVPVGCFSPDYPEGNPCGQDSACPPGQACGADNVCRSNPGEAVTDAGVTSDAEVAAVDPACVVVGSTSSFHLDFEDPATPFLDRVGGVNGDEVQPVGTGESVCGAGSALFAGSGLIAYPDADVWDQVGSIDLTVRISALPAPGDPVYLFSRDASGVAEPGHVGVAVSSDGRVVMRLQNQGDTWLCTEAASVTVGIWHRIGVNFGDPEVELWLDGNKAEFQGVVGDIDCSLRGLGLTMAGNAEPLAIGAATSVSVPGTVEPFTALLSAELDEFVVDTQRKGFAP